MSKITNLLQLPVVEVHWRDATSDSGHVTYEDGQAHEPTECRTVGYLLAKTRRKVVVAQLIGAHGEMGCTFAIPHDWTTRVVTLKKGQRVNSPRARQKGRRHG